MLNEVPMKSPNFNGASKFTQILHDLAISLRQDIELLYTLSIVTRRCNG